MPKESNKTAIMADVKSMPGRAAGLEISPGNGNGRQNIEDLWSVAQVLHQSGMVPKAFEDAKQVMYALAMGQDLGFTNTQSLACITVINNKPSVYADGLPAILHRSGHYFIEEFSGTIEDGTYKASITIERKDTGSVMTREFSVDDAKRAGLWQTEAIIKKSGRNGPYETKNDSPWWKYPKRMIWRRAIGWAVRDALADEMYGLQIVEEQEDHLKTIRETAEPKTSKFGQKVLAMGDPEDEDVIEIDQDPEDIEVEDIDVDVEEEQDLPPEVNDTADEELPEARGEGLANEGDPELEGDNSPSPSSEDPAAEKVFDSNGRNLPGGALDWFDYLNGPLFDPLHLGKDFADEQGETWYKELSAEDKEYVDAETNKIVEKQKEGAA